MTVEIKRKLKSIINQTSLLQKLAFWYLNHQADIAKRNILRRKREKANSTIKVGFIVQMPEVWDKEAPVTVSISLMLLTISSSESLQGFDYRNPSLKQSVYRAENRLVPKCGTLIRK